MDIDFMLQYPIPDNHRFLYHATSRPHPDFIRRCGLYEGHTAPLGPDYKGCASQFIVITNEGEALTGRLADAISGISIVRATSPLDHVSSWIEVFPEGVSKGKSAAWLCRRLGIGRHQTVGIGNDYNDNDLLEFTADSFVTPDAPLALRSQFRQAGSIDSTPLMEAMGDRI
jgi:hypothetical protein